MQLFFCKFKKQTSYKHKNSYLQLAKMILKLFQTLNPFESVAFYFTYLRRVDSFRNDGHALQRGQFGLFLCIIFLKSAHFGFLFAYPLNKVDQILQFDIVTLILGDRQLNIIGTIGLAMSVYIYYVFFIGRPTLLNNAVLANDLCEHHQKFKIG